MQRVEQVHDQLLPPVLQCLDLRRLNHLSNDEFLLVFKEHTRLLVKLSLKPQQRMLKRRLLPTLIDTTNALTRHPCDRAGREITAIKHGAATYQLAADITAQHAFSNKPGAGYPDYHAKLIPLHRDSQCAGKVGAAGCHRTYL